MTASSRIVSLGYGVRRPKLITPSARERIRADAAAWQSVIPWHGCFTHVTGAVLRGWWHPPLPPSMPLVVAQCGAQHPPQRAGLRVNRHRILPRWDDIDGVRVASAGEILLACARELGALDLLILAEAAVYAGEDLDAIHAAAARRRRGAPALRTVLGAVQGHAESLWEVVIRAFHDACEVPTRAQHEVFDEQGTFIARGDLWLVGTRTLHEYDGEHHLRRAQQRDDLRRARDLTNADWIRRGYTNVDLLEHHAEMLRDCDLALGRPHHPERLRAWEDLLSDSLLTVPGSQRFRRRIAEPRAVFRTKLKDTAPRREGP